MHRLEDTIEFYRLLNELEQSTGGKQTLRDCDGRMDWPERGVYFFFEPGEQRSESGDGLRVVRVGTHALSARARATLWNRLRQHRGNLNPPGGNHRGSVFRKLVGEALVISGKIEGVDTWGHGNTAPRAVRDAEQPIEREVSRYIGAMPFLVVPILDGPGPGSKRGYIERNAIALLSGYGAAGIDAPSSSWLGYSSARVRVCGSGLWNNNHVDEEYSREFLDVFRTLIADVKLTPN